MSYGWAELGIRQKLLDLGREAGGEYFVVLDADEAFTNPFNQIGRKIIQKLEPGQKMILKWLAMWKSVEHYRDDDSVWAKNYKDFIFRDDKKLEYPKIWMHTPRTPGRYASEELDLNLNAKYGAVMHFQFSDWDAFQIKQAWYKISELIKEPNNIENVNNKYKITLDDSNVLVSSLLSEQYKNITLPNFSYKKNYEDYWRYKDIKYWFEKHGVDKYAKLDIWHIPQINQLRKK